VAMRTPQSGIPVEHGSLFDNSTPSLAQLMPYCVQ
jgi:hypothetical protein